MAACLPDCSATARTIRARRRRALMVRAVALQSGRHAAMDFPRG